jgi:hypothetical protein
VFVKNTVVKVLLPVDSCHKVERLVFVSEVQGVPRLFGNCFSSMQLFGRSLHEQYVD